MKSLNREKNFSHIISNSIFVFSLVIIIVIGIIIFYQFNKLRRANTWVTHTYQVILEADRSIYYFNYLESRQRGYLLFNDNEFLPNVNFNLERINSSVKKLLNITKDNIDQNNRVQKYVKAINERIVILKEMINLKNAKELTTKEANDLFVKGKFLSEEINNIAQEIVDTELILLEERNNMVTKDAWNVNLIFIIGGVLSIIFLLFAFLLSRKQSRNQLIVEKNTKTIANQLNSLIEGARDMIAALDLNYQYIIFNQSYKNEFKNLFGKDITIGDNLKTILEDEPEINNKLIEVWRESLSGHNQTKTIDFTKNNIIQTYEITPSLIKNADNEVMGAVHIIRNITERIKEKNEIKLSYEKLNNVMTELKDKNEKITLLLEMSDILLASHSVKELSNITAKYCGKILNFTKGNFYIMHPSKDMLEISSRWRNPCSVTDNFYQDQCWSLRLGHIHYSNFSNESLICDHINIKNSKINISYLCVPLRAQNDIFGVLYVEYESNHNKNQLTSTDRLIINAFAEVTALALANVRLKENLRYQSIRDPLTSLYNRRYLEEFLTKQVHQSERTNMPITLLLLDLDHFKRINDVYGHDAGDIVLKEFSQLLVKEIRPGDLASRYGGEEFIIVLYNTDKETGQKRAETIRENVSHLHLKYGTQDILEVTVSIGVSFFPLDARSGEELIELADKALYRAKNNGRNKVVLYEEILTTKV